MAVSIRDVAKAARVSVSAASKALNDYPDIGEETRKRVKNTARKLGYIPNKSAKMLASKNTKDVAILFSGLLEGEQVDEISTSIMKGVNSYIIKHKMNAATYAIDSKIQEEKKLVEFCHEYSLSGVLLFGLRIDDKYVQEAQNSTIPCVGVDYKISGPCTTFVSIDDCKAFEEITEYVISQNHKKLVLVFGRVESEVANERYKGFCQALKKHDMNIEEVPVIYTDFQEVEACIKVREFIDRYGKENGTVFICMSDMVAMGVYRAVKQSGYSIPEDFSVTGFDGLSFLGFVEPRLTTVDQRFYEKGYEAGRLIERLVNGERNLDEVVLRHEIVYGNSVKKL